MTADVITVNTNVNKEQVSQLKKTEKVRITPFNLQNFKSSYSVFLTILSIYISFDLDFIPHAFAWVFKAFQVLKNKSRYTREQGLNCRIGPVSRFLVCLFPIFLAVRPIN